jgi:hypothetical protein
MGKLDSIPAIRLHRKACKWAQNAAAQMAQGHRQGHRHAATKPHSWRQISAPTGYTLTLALVALLIAAIATFGGSEPATAATATCHPNVTPQRALRCHFGVGRKYREAVAIARCESGLNPRAVNGQYRGLFQVSANLRATVPGYGSSAYRQAKHARNIYRRSGWQHWRGFGCW